MTGITARTDIQNQIDVIGSADIVIGDPSYNNARTIGHVVRAVQAGWAKNTIVRALMEDIVRMTVRVQKTSTKIETASQELQIVQTTMDLNYSFQPDKVGDVYKTLGANREVSEKIINPGIEESSKSAAARYTAEELIS